MTKRSYGQYCGLARALDVVGGRWSLLIVRELLVGPARYSDLLAGTSGIATNLLSARLRDLEEVGVVERSLDRDSNGVLYSLTPWGGELRDAVAALVKWSTPLMITGPQDDSFRTNWLAVALDALLHENKSEVSATVGLEVQNTIVSVHIDDTGTHIALNGEPPPTTVLCAEPAVVLGLASGMLTVEQAVLAGEFRGDPGDFEVVFGQFAGAVRAIA
jgi:DNA-binding HxlR family transcriptional regulator